MKKVVISVVATILVLFFLAQTGLLAPFGIKQLSIFTREKTENESVEKTGEEYSDPESGLSFRFKATTSTYTEKASGRICL